MTADRDHRAAAIVAAATWQPWTPSEPRPDQIDSLLELADRLAAWIAGDEEEQPAGAPVLECPWCGYLIAPGDHIEYRSSTLFPTSPAPVHTRCAAQIDGQEDRP